MDLENVNTEGKFQHRMKPGIVHPPQIVCRAVEEVQKIIVANKSSSEETMKLFQDIKDRLTKLENHVGLGIKQEEKSDATG